jgi:hypothetical protein
MNESGDPFYRKGSKWDSIEVRHFTHHALICYPLGNIKDDLSYKRKTKEKEETWPSEK